MPEVEIFINDVACLLTDTHLVDLDLLRQHCLELAIMAPGNQVRLHVDGVEKLVIVVR